MMLHVIDSYGKYSTRKNYKRQNNVVRSGTFLESRLIEVRRWSYLCLFCRNHFLDEIEKKIIIIINLYIYCMLYECAFCSLGSVTFLRIFIHFWWQTNWTNINNKYDRITFFSVQSKICGWHFPTIFVNTRMRINVRVIFSVTICSWSNGCAWNNQASTASKRHENLLCFHLFSSLMVMHQWCRYKCFSSLSVNIIRIIIFIFLNKRYIYLFGISLFSICTRTLHFWWINEISFALPFNCEKTHYNNDSNSHWRSLGAFLWI